MERFPHLKFLQKVVGKPRLHGGGEQHPISLENKNNRQQHFGYLSNQTSKMKSDWQNKIDNREGLNLAPLDADVIPIFLKINPDLIGYDFDLKLFGIEVISEEEDGYIIGASLDAFNSLNDKIQKFLSEERGGAKIADFWEIVDGNQWKPSHILSDYLKSIWGDVYEEGMYKLEVGIAFDKPMNKKPDPNIRGYEAKLERFRAEQIERDERFEERQDEFENFINHYGTITSSFIDLDDSFCCEVEITGKGFKDLVFNYPFVFEVSETDEVVGINSEIEEVGKIEFEVIAPDLTSPEVGVIDSGIMEGHRFLSSAVIGANSKCYIDGDQSTADHVRNGGHGTRVAGAILYPYGLTSIQSPYQLPCFVRNLRVLDKENKLTHKLPAELMKLIVEENEDCKIFNLSINSNVASRLKHMSSWAATIDTLMNKNKVLFLISTGNITKDDIRHYINQATQYPNFLDEPHCRIANPAQSSFAITVGSVNHISFEDDNFISLGAENEISAFSRVGTGIWGMIKPDVVEYGGGLVISKEGNLVSNKESISPELIRSTLNGGSAIGSDVVGTSFATPKVTHIAAQLLKLYPDEDISLLRALIVQGARLPNSFFENPTSQSIKHFGYGIPSLERVTNNTHQRVTFYNAGNIKAEEGHIYSLNIPEFLRSPVEEHDILIEVTLSYTSKVRRTRQRTKSYLSTWLDWTSSKVGELYEDFKDYVLKEIEESETTYDKDVRNSMSGWNWKIKSDSRGIVEGISRNNSTVQKDWTIIKSHELPSDISFAVRGHKGWDRSHEEVSYSLVVSIEILNSNLEIYEAIRIENEIELET
ncbi:Subtilase family protein [Flavobacterium sp. CF108]|uniref:S8 family peptidase n=1 Tax=unclassified Flavobacterium TaxID=196869 RepID=UPI0008BB3EC6|nr:MULTISPECIES: S8 family peptidase [unclassified Flavobacterium]SEN62337.1 Subtilase family protein [Flavobacterium sp. fv08]SHH04401.1 Subtilase family protein [Flavobacterium sp. CF108]